MASSAVLNVSNSRALAVGRWDTTRKVLDIFYSTKIKVMGFSMTKTIAQSGTSSWARLTNMLRTQAREAYSRDLGISLRIQYVHTYLLGNLWHSAQIFPVPRDCIREIVSAMIWYVWQGAIFRVPISTLQRRKEKRNGSDRRGGKISGTPLHPDVDPEPMRRIDICRIVTVFEAANGQGKPPGLEDIEDHGIFAYILPGNCLHGPPAQNENPRAFRHRVYESLCTILKADNMPRTCESRR
jgi:hypothetical protein